MGDPHIHRHCVSRLMGRTGRPGRGAPAGTLLPSGRGPVAVAVTVAVLAGSLVGCGRDRIRAGNLRELREKKEALREEQERAMDAAAAGPDGAVVQPLPSGLARVRLRGSDGDSEEIFVREFRVAHHERDYLAGGGVRDHEHQEKAFTFRVGLSLRRFKIRKLERVEFLSGSAGTGRGRLRFHFRTPGRDPEEMPAEKLLGAEHPIPPALAGDSADGPVRLPIFAPPDAGAYHPLVEVEFAP